MKFFIETIGCQMNVCESAFLADKFLALAMQKSSSAQEADIVVLNTCSVRAQAEQKAFSFLGRMEEMKKEGKLFKIVVMGCMAQRISERLKSRFKTIDLIVGTDDSAIKSILKLAQEPAQKSINPQKHFDISHYVSVMKGCNNFCSYCIVPFVRGVERSIDIDEILSECRIASKNGAKEIVLLGQNVNSYAFKGLGFSHLIKRIAEIEEILRIRFMTNHPKDLNDELIQTIASQDKVCKHIHLPMQSASDKILKLMNRKYDFKRYLNLIENIRKNIPQINVTTDIIVGFPSETQEDFEMTFEAVKAIRFSSLFAFKYSPRPQTHASQMADDVALDEKQRRLSLILELGNEISMQTVSEMKGSVQDVLFEKYQDGILEGKTQGCRKVIASGGSVQDLGTIGQVLIKETKINALFGDIKSPKGVIKNAISKAKAI